LHSIDVAPFVTPFRFRDSLSLVSRTPFRFYHALSRFHRFSARRLATRPSFDAITLDRSRIRASRRIRVRSNAMSTRAHAIARERRHSRSIDD